MTQLLSGSIRKMKAVLETPVLYSLPVGDATFPISELVGKRLSLLFTGTITCVGCGRSTNKSFNQGYCYPCFTSKAACDLCVLSPDRCHFAEGTCREPAWGDENCNVPHIVYLANTGALKVGITRETQVPTRFIDQGARQALPVFRVTTRYQSGILEVAFKEHVADRTQWQRMLKAEAEPLDMRAERDALLPLLAEKLAAFHERFGSRDVQTLGEVDVIEIRFPVLEYPKKVSSRNFDKTPLVEGTLLGIKGQYLILDSGVLNLRKYAGYHLEVQSDS